ncbi:MAG: L-threonylcarbamoyladenylate synthase [Cytophagales bacterium]|nr:L-threonylcarbamoyladenylate synthase [Cytophagales bacterium]MDW8384676.1 L-threonylcarbamoyladenylate synthase [Flammeovirgaceae bacterium]
MSAIVVEINPKNPPERKILQVVEMIKEGAIVVYPTDTVYGLGCDIFHPKAIQRLCRIKGVEPSKANLSFICYDLSDLSLYAKNISNSLFKLMKRALPGPYTFILEASSEVPKILHYKKKQIGIRIPDHKVPREIVRLLGNPIITTSLKRDDEIAEYPTEISEIVDLYGKIVDVIIDSGSCGNTPSTIIDGTTDNFEVVRYGAGKVEELL